MSIRALVPCSFLLFPLLAFATTYLVEPDGTGDFLTIQAALDKAEDGDVVELADGTFTGDGNRDLDYLGKDVTVRSQSGNPEACVIDCGGSEGDPHRAFHFRSGETNDAVLEGIQITGGWNDTSPRGGGILLQGEASPTIRSCVFKENYGSAVLCSTSCAPRFEDCDFLNNEGWQGGGVYSLAGLPVLQNCYFHGNSAHLNGGAIHAHAGRITLNDCGFVENTASSAGALNLLFGTIGEVTDCYFRKNSAEHSGAIHNFFADLVLERCTFVGNMANTDGGAFSSGKMSTTIMRNCTFYGNGASWGTLLCGESWTILENTIIASGVQGQAIQVACPVTLTCCDIYGNPGGDWTESIADQYGVRGNISEDPVFCSPETNDFTLDAASPCAPFSPPNSDCGLIGAWPVTCGGTATERTTWGDVKMLFRE